MNLTITTHPKNKHPDIHHPPPTSAHDAPNKQPLTNTAQRQDCGSIFFVNCLNVNATEPSQQNELLEQFHIQKLPSLVSSPDKNIENSKRKIALSLVQRSPQQAQTPRVAAHIKEEQSKQSLQTTPTKGMKLTLNTVSPSQLSNIRIQQPQLQPKPAFPNSSHPIHHQVKSGQKLPATIPNTQLQRNFDQTKQQLEKRSSFDHYSFNRTQKYQILESNDTPQKQQEEQLHQEDHSIAPINYKQMLKDRRWIGEYAKTIRTFNASDPKENSEAESIVLERGHHHFKQGGMAVTPVNRGSIKEYGREEEETLKRGYGSVGQELHKAQLDMRFNKYISQAIEEDLYDSQI